MCGIVGMAGKLTAQHKDIMSALLTVCSLRGMHSTGTFVVKGKDNEIQVNKAVGPPIELFNTVSYDRLSTYNASVFAGHCRAATHGAINRRNAHPFESDNVVGMHNGTLHNWRSYLDDSSFFDVDSECLLHNIGLHGAEKVIPKVRGAYALVWYDKEAGVLNFIRNDLRPMWFCMTENKEVMFWASEYWMLDMLRSEHGKRQKFLEDKQENLYYEIESDTLIRYKINHNAGIKDKVFTQLAVKKLEGDSSQPTYNAPFQSGYSTGTRTPTPTSTPSSANTPPWGWETDKHWERVWGDEEWKQMEIDENPQQPPLITDKTKVAEEGKTLMQTFREKVLSKRTQTTPNLVTQIGPIPRASVVTTVVGKTPTSTTGTKSTDTLSPKASSKGTTSSKGSQTRQTSSLTLVSDNKKSTSRSSKKQDDLFFQVNPPVSPLLDSRGRIQNFKQFTESTGGCCASCDEVLTFEDFTNDKTKIAWLGQDSFLCNDCNTIPLEEQKAM